MVIHFNIQISDKLFIFFSSFLVLFWFMTGVVKKKKRATKAAAFLAFPRRSRQIVYYHSFDHFIDVVILADLLDKANALLAHALHQRINWIITC